MDSTILNTSNSNSNQNTKGGNSIRVTFRNVGKTQKRKKE